ncbi:PrsW family intramembrane metalloprotease [Actinomadura craniellae]|uniref:PrsW family intramembrane metalloprotease n=1 Tax=Actinomadura craniellae TaxID=2231787 RepID=A0A365HC24_9ACTN|nr:PrsW family glutamic-type intramembrane protease [Actinomadura craniellae]RAY16589.1 PrsW family intramembrane metalloprotease [Actinomadura craniellae]
MPSVVRRWAWTGVFAGGLAMYLAVLATLVDTGNPNYLPSLILLGSVLIPATFLTFASGRSGQWQVPALTLGTAALFGGVVGTVVAGVVEYDTLRELGVLPALGIGLIEETAKLIVPVIMLMWAIKRGRPTRPADGLVIGVAVGMGFASLETMGYAFTALISSGGNVGDVETTLLLRGLLSPAGHMAWTALICGSLWSYAAAPALRTALTVPATYLAAVVLHACWDGIGGLAAYILLGLISVGWLLWELHRTRALPLRPTAALAPIG